MAIIGDISEVRLQAAGTHALHKGLVFLERVLAGGFPEIDQRVKQLQAGQSFEEAIHGKEVFAIFQAYTARERKDAFLEAHKEFTDLQCVLNGEEFIEVQRLSEHSTAPAYDANNNVFFPLQPEARTRFHMKRPMVAVLFPEDAHAPCVRIGSEATLIRKVVVKVKHGGQGSNG